MTKWMNENIDTRYRRVSTLSRAHQLLVNNSSVRIKKIFKAVKIQRRYEDYTGRLQSGLDSECSITFVADDEDIDNVSVFEILNATD